MRWAVVLGLAAIFAVFVGLAFIAAPDGDERTVVLSTDVMLPTIPIDGEVTLDESAYDDSEPSPGEIVAFTPPVGALTNKCGAKFKLNSGCDAPTEIAEGEGGSIEFIMRVVAGPGDQVAVESGRVVLNGARVDEPYAEPCEEKAGCELPAAVRVPDGHVYVLGDNRFAAKDSRYWGPLPLEGVLGRVDAG